jgi:hypothetical protein
MRCQVLSACVDSVDFVYVSTGESPDARCITSAWDRPFPRFWYAQVLEIFLKWGGVNCLKDPPTGTDLSHNFCGRGYWGGWYPNISQSTF